MDTRQKNREPGRERDSQREKPRREHTDSGQRRTPREAEARERRAPREAEARERRTPREAEARERRAPREAEARERRAPREAEARERRVPREAEARERRAPREAEAGKRRVPQEAGADRKREARDNRRVRRPAAPEERRSAKNQRTKEAGLLFGRKSQKKTNEPPQGTSYQRSTEQKKKSLLAFMATPPKKKETPPTTPEEAARARQNQREEQSAHRKKRALLFDTPAVIYTQPKPFNRSRLVVQLLTVLAVAVAFVMALSIFFKVEVITVSGAETYSAWAIREASGISEGDRLLTFSRARASGQIQANLPYVENVRIGIKLPNTVNIEVEEVEVAYSVQSYEGNWWLITSEGKVVQQIVGSAAGNYTKVLGVTLDNPIINEIAFASETAPTETSAEGETVPVTTTGAQQLNAALEILRALEDNDIVGEAASVDVSNLQQIELWYGQRYQVNLGDNTRLDYKIACMYDVVLQMSDYQTGMLDISFNTLSDQVIYTPFA